VRAGAAGVAVIGAVWGRGENATDPAAAARALRASVA
jgi:thiamine monophosphate synthase